jgi:hypothetical protein
LENGRKSFFFQTFAGGLCIAPKKKKKKRVGLFRRDAQTPREGLEKKTFSSIFQTKKYQFFVSQFSNKCNIKRPQKSFPL